MNIANQRMKRAKIGPKWVSKRSGVTMSRTSAGSKTSAPPRKQTIRPEAGHGGATMNLPGETEGGLGYGVISPSAG